MDYHERELLISKIKSGKLRYKDRFGIIYICKPSLDIEYEANEIFKEEFESAYEDEILTDKELHEIMIEFGLWSIQEEDQLENIAPKHVEYWKIKIFESQFRTEEQKRHRVYLRSAENELNRLMNKRHEFDYATCEGYARYAKNLFLLKNTSYLDNTLINPSIINLNVLLTFYYESILSDKVIRELARTNPWYDDWHVLKNNGSIFEGFTFTYNQKSLVSWSILYENIHESPDCPSSDVINDDDALDGWLITQKRKREKDQNQRAVDAGLSDKIKQANEVFIMADTPADAQKIAELNDPRAQSIRKSRWAQMKRGDVSEQNFADSKQEQMVMMTQLYNRKMGGK